MAEPVVKNAADPAQVKRAGRIERDKAKEFGALMQATMASADARALLWALLGRAKIYQSVFHRDSNVMAYNAGRQDFGHEIMAEIIAADPALYLQMEREARDRDTRDERLNDAAHTRNADAAEGANDAP